MSQLSILCFLNRKTSNWSATNLERPHDMINLFNDSGKSLPESFYSFISGVLLHTLFWCVSRFINSRFRLYQKQSSVLCGGCLGGRDSMKRMFYFYGEVGMCRWCLHFLRSVLSEKKCWLRRLAFWRLLLWCGNRLSLMMVILQ